jgi:dihydropteroate synthase
MLRILPISDPKEIKQIMRGIRVDSYGIKIMAPKAVTHLIKVDSLSCIAANVLKQELLSLGADAAVSRDTLTGRTRKTDCLLMGNLSQFSRLNQKLCRQPFGLNKLAQALKAAIDNYQKDNFRIDLGGHKLNLSVGRAKIMGIVNITPDSFSGDGLLRARSVRLKADILEYAEQLIKDGADIIDIGGESSRPGAKAVSVKEEISRVIPAIALLAKKIKVPISVDTSKPEVARAALDSGAVMVNDIFGLRNNAMIKLVARHKAAVVIMHMKGNPRTMQKNPAYKSLLDEIMEYLNQSVNKAVSGGIDKGKIIIDPGIGFGKSLQDNLEVLNKLKSFKVLGMPIMVGPSRKSFIGKILNMPPEERVFGTVSACVLAAQNGASVVRTHDVKAVKQALRIADSINKL